jgi:hypothetical protein
VVWAHESPEESSSDARNSPYVQEQADLVHAIRSASQINETRNVAVSTLVAIMGRISAYTGKEVTWDEVMSSELCLGPKEYALGPVPMGAAPIPGA